MISATRDATLASARLLVAFIFLYHGLAKALDPAMAAEKFAEFGLPGMLGPVVGWTEVVAGVLLALGFLHLLAALALLVIIAGALVIVQFPGGFGAGLERDLMILVGLAVLLAHGPGRWSVDARLGDTGP